MQALTYKAQAVNDPHVDAKQFVGLAARVSARQVTISEKSAPRVHQNREPIRLRSPHDPKPLVVAEFLVRSHNGIFSQRAWAMIWRSNGSLWCRGRSNSCNA